MSFLDCIRTAVADGKIKPEKGMAAEAAFQRYYDDAIAQGTPEAKAVSDAALRAVEEVANLNAVKKWERVNQLKVAHQISTEVKATKSLPQLQDFLIRQGDKIETSYNRVLGMGMALFDRNLEAYRPRAVGLINPVHNMDEIVDVLYGAGGSQTARELADEVANVQEFYRKLANSYGASIPENKNRRLPQMHDAQKMRNIAATEAASKEMWIQDHLDALDWDVMRYDGKPILFSQRREILEKTWNTITQDGFNKIVPGQTSVEHLATRMNRQRFLYYKDAKSWKAMNEKYGEGNVFHQMVTMMDSMSRDIALLENLGPNPKAMVQYQADLARRQAADLATKYQKPNERRYTSRIASDLEVFNRRYAILSRSFLSGAESGWANVIGTVRTVTAASLLQGAYIANLGDVAFIKDAAAFNGLPQNGTIRKYIRDFIPNRENRQWATQSGLIFESAISQVINNNRFFGPMMGHNIARRISDTTFRATLLTQHNQISKWVWGMQVMGAFSQYKTRSWSKLNPDFRASLERSRITAEDWDILRATPENEYKGGRFIRPIDLWNETTGNVAQKRKVAEKFLNYIHDTGRRAVPEQDSRVQQLLGGHLDRTSFLSNAVQLLNLVKGFPLVMHMVHMRDNWQWQTPGQRMRSMARFAMYLTVAGAAITQLRELANGRDPKNMNPLENPTFWLEAAVNGGTFGMLGDFAAAFVRGDMTRVMESPPVKLVSDTGDLLVGNILELLSGDDPKVMGDVAKWLSRYGIVGWQFRLAFRRYLESELLRNSDPAAYRRLQSLARQLELETQQQYWWQPGTPSPQRAPNLAAAFGG